MAVLRDWREERRLRCLELYKKGWQQKDIAEALGVTKGAVSQWIKLLKDVPEEKQVEVLRIRKSTGRPSAIVAKDRPKLVALIHEGAEAAGFLGDAWTAARVRDAARSKLGIRVGLTTINKFLHAEGFSVQKPTVKATQQNEAAVQKFRADWQETKKGLSKQAQP